MEPFEDPNHIYNSSKYHSGKACIERDCDNPAGTAWSPFWCFQHNKERLERIGKQFDKIASIFK